MADGVPIVDAGNSGPGVSNFNAAVAGDPNIIGGVLGARATIRSALATWAAAADIHFIEVADNGRAFNAAGATGDIRFGAHNFAGGTLAHGYYPPPNGVSAAGDIHFDGEYLWSNLAATPGTNYDLQSVALHEVGHAIGLTHGAGADVMGPTIGAGTQERVLSAADIGFAQAIYGLPGHNHRCTRINGVIVDNPNLPPPGVYLTPRQVHARYSGPALEIVLSRIRHRPFSGATRTQTPNGEVENFESELTGTATIFRVGGQTFPEGLTIPIMMNGPTQTIVYGKSSEQTTGEWDTEMQSMNLTGQAGAMTIMIRESPTLTSLGGVFVTQGSTEPESGHDDPPPTGGTPLYMINSYFDVFTEISIDGGLTWTASDGATGVGLAVPEPSSLILLAVAGLLGLGRRVRLCS